MREDFEAFVQARERLVASGRLLPELVCKVGDPEAPTLKLLKSSWTNDSHTVLRNFSGVFFSVWEGTRPSEQGVVLYNIHSLKLRGLEGYRLESRKFAFAFRDRFEPHAKDWPNVSTEFGPLTLMQGWIERRPDHLTQDIVSLAERFLPLVPIIDDLLNSGKVGPRR